MTGALRRHSLALLLVGLLAVALTACGGPSAPEPARPDPVALSANVPGGTAAIGVVISYTSPPGQGAEWRDAAAGAQVAVKRLALGGTRVTLVVRDDKGSVAGSTAAVRELARQQVAGIVMATSGSHLSGGLTAAAEAGIPVLLPYAGTATGPGVWTTGAARAAADAALASAVTTSGATRPLLVDAGGGAVAGIRPTATVNFRAGGDAAALAASLSKRRSNPDQTFDAVVVSGPAQLQAVIVQALQGAGITVPVLLTGQALSPAFPAALAKAGGSLATSFTTAGVDDGDATALASSERGRALAAYFAALRLQTEDPKATDLLGDQPFRAVGGVADVASHDAVLALVRAVAAANSVDPAAVAAALPPMRLGAAEGLAGTPLDFSSPTAVPADAVVVLNSTPESPGVRPHTAATTPRLYWFPQPPA